MTKTFSKKLLKQNIIGLMFALASDVSSLCIIKGNLNLIAFLKFMRPYVHSSKNISSKN